MKRLSYLLLVAVLMFGSACGGGNKQAQNNTPPATEAATVPVVEEPVLEKTSIKFTGIEHDFGKVKEGEKVTYSYEFENTGNADLLLQKVKPSCGCTTPKYTREPVRPGKKGSVEVVFNTKGHPGMQHKTVSVTSNTDPAVTVLSFTCEVLPTEEKKSN